jgi:hypothetical protein
MKKTVLFLLALSMGYGAWSQENKSPIDGVYKLAYEYEVKGDHSTMIYPDENQGSELKIWSEGTFTLVGVFVKDTSYTDNFGAGTFTLNGNRYEETVLFHSAPQYMGEVVKLRLEMEGDTITQWWPVDENTEPIKSHYYIEKWVRLQ